MSLQYHKHSQYTAEKVNLINIEPKVDVDANSSKNL